MCYSRTQRGRFRPWCSSAVHLVCGFRAEKGGTSGEGHSVCNSNPLDALLLLYTRKTRLSLLPFVRFLPICSGQRAKLSALVGGTALALTRDSWKGGEKNEERADREVRKEREEMKREGMRGGERDAWQLCARRGLTCTRRRVHRESKVTRCMYQRLSTNEKSSSFVPPSEWCSHSCVLSWAVSRAQSAGVGKE